MPKPKTRANGTGTAFKRGKTWTCEVVVGYKADENGTMRPVRRTKGGFRTKTDALNYAQELKSSGLARQKDKPVTLDILWRAFSSTTLPKKSISTRNHCATARRRIESIAHVDLRLLSIDDLQGVIAKHAPTYYPAKDIKDLLSQLYKRAVAEQYVTVNLARYIELPQNQSTETAAFTEEEVDALWKEWNTTHDRIAGCSLLMIYTGMMPGELCGLKPGMIDFATQTITGAGLKTEIRKEKPIVLPDIILPVLRDLCEQTIGGKIINLGVDAFAKHFHAMIDRLGLNPQLRPYSCRHTTATALAKTDTPIFAMKDIMRHANITTTQRYVHIDTSDLINTANSIATKSTPNLLPTTEK